MTSARVRRNRHTVLYTAAVIILILLAGFVPGLTGVAPADAADGTVAAWPHLGQVGLDVVGMLLFALFVVCVIGTILWRRER